MTPYLLAYALLSLLAALTIYAALVQAGRARGRGFGKLSHRNKRDEKK